MDESMEELWRQVCLGWARLRYWMTHERRYADRIAELAEPYEPTREPWACYEPPATPDPDCLDCFQGSRFDPHPQACALHDMTAACEDDHWHYVEGRWRHLQLLSDDSWSIDGVIFRSEP